jgi:hypothetical protein
VSEQATLLDAGAAAREVATIVAFAILQTGGDGGQALRILAKLEGVAPPEFNELDCVTIGAQAIRDAEALRGSEARDG